MNLKALVEKELKTKGLSYRALANEIGVSAGVLAYLIANDPPRTMTTLKKFAAYFKVDISELLDGGSVKETRVPYQPGPAPSPAADRLLDMLQDFDQEEQAAMLNCAELLQRGDMTTRQHVIGQMKLLLRTMPKKRPTSPKRATG